jgi:hypothetical protein
MGCLGVESANSSGRCRDISRGVLTEVFLEWITNTRRRSSEVFVHMCPVVEIVVVMPSVYSRFRTS